MPDRRTRSVLSSQGAQQLPGCVLESEHEEQEDQPDTGADRYEALSGDERQETALAEGQPRGEIERHGREPDRVRKARQDR